jgi:hypothetical protein
MNIKTLLEIQGWRKHTDHTTLHGCLRLAGAKWRKALFWFW